MPIYAKSAKEGEPEETLSEHTLQCLKAGNILIENLPFGAAKKKRLGIDLSLALATHDTGKAATGFQKSLAKGADPWKRRHEILSAAFASSLGLKEEIVFAVITHHKTLPSNGISSIYGCLPDEQIPYAPDHVFPVWDQMAEEWYENIPSFAEEWPKICETINRKDLSIDFKKLTPLSINLGSNWLGRDNQAECISYKHRYYASLLRGLLISSDHITSSGSRLPVRIPRLNEYNTANTLEEDLRGFQKRTSKKIGNLILRAPTGSGKTLAALLWTHRNQKNNGRLFYALPTTASLNAMYLRLKEYFNDNKSTLVGLLHSRVASSIYSMLEEDSSSKISNQATARSLSSLAREMYFPIRVCTPHQILRYSLQGKGWELMLSEFPNSCFVFDEIHAYNPKLTGLTMATAKFLIDNNATCMFLYATLPKFIRKLIEHEMGSIDFLQPSYKNDKDKQILNQKRHILGPSIDGDILSNIDLIVEETKKAMSTLVVCNHVPTAQQVYRELKGRINSTVLLHSQFCRRDRNKIENRLFKKIPKLLVSTQVVEVSLDIDFEQGFLEPAPIDAIVQRLGRINRYGKRRPTQVRIFKEQQHSFNIYDEDLTYKSLEVLSSLPSPLGEEDLNQAADRVYGKGYSYDYQIEYEEGLNYYRLKKFKKYLIAGTDQDWVDEVIDEMQCCITCEPTI